MSRKGYEKHESFGMVSFSRVSGKSNFFGSNITHHNFIELEIREGEVKTENGREWYYAGNKIISVRMTQLQFSELLTTMNTSGIPCTIEEVMGKKMEKIPQPKTIKQVIVNEISENEKEFLKQLELDRMLIEEALGNKRIKSDEKALIRSMMNKMVQHLTKNRPFYEESIKERINRGIIEAKQEVEASIQNKIQSAGLEALGAKPREIK